MLLIVLALSASRLGAEPLGRAFTYQGRLNDGGAPANGSYDLKFTLCDAAGGGASVINVPLTNAATPVSNGLFTVVLDFGPGAFSGDARWLEIGVRTNGSAADFVPLTPRQSLTATPFARYAASAGTAASAGIATMASSVSVGAVDNAALQTGAVDTSKIADSAVGTAQIANNTITTAHLADGAVTGAKLFERAEWVAEILTNPPPDLGGKFGISVAVVGTNRLLIGASDNNKAHVFHLFDSIAYYSLAITNPTPAVGDDFAYSLAAVDTDRFLVGAPQDDAGSNNAGAAYLFNLSGNLLTTFTNPTPAAGENFGYALCSVGADRVLIAAPSDRMDGLVGAGAAYLFDLSGNLLVTYKKPTPVAYDNFGQCVAAVGNDRVLIGVMCDDTSANNAGAAYLFDLAGNLLTVFTNPTPAVSDQFGCSGAAVGTDRVLIGAMYEDTGTANAGAAYLFDLSGQLLTTFTNPAPVVGDMFGRTVAALGSNRILIGAPYKDVVGLNDGAVYLFDSAGNLLESFNNARAGAGDLFGTSLAGLGNDQLLIGAPEHDGYTADDGAAFLFRVVSRYTPDLVAEGVRLAGVTSSMLAENAVQSPNLAYGAVTGDKLANGSVTQDKLAAEAVGGAQLAPDAVNTVHILNGTIQSHDLADGAVTSLKLAAGAVSSNTIANNAVGSDQLADNARLPVGMVTPFAGNNVPPGWLLCYGQAVNRTTYAALFAVLGTTHGSGDGSTTFNLPDMRGRSVFGKDNMGGSAANRVTTSASGVAGISLGTAGGSETVSLTASQMPLHNHTVNDPGHSHSYQDPGHHHSYLVPENAPSPGFPYIAHSEGDVDVGSRTTSGANVGISINSNLTGISVNGAGAGSAHNNLPPAIILNFIIKY